jgi:hypothetical protein
MPVIGIKISRNESEPTELLNIFEKKNKTFNRK